MPDVFGGLGIIALVAVLLARSQPPLWQRMILYAMVVFSGMSSTANVLTLVPIALFCLLIRRVWLELGVPIRLLITTVTLTAVTLALPIAWNFAKFGKPSLNVASGALLFSKLVDAGLAQRYLAEKCSISPHPICEHLNKLVSVPSSQSFLWDGSPPLASQLNAWRDPDNSFKELAYDILRTYPVEALKLALNDTFHLFTALTLDFNDELKPYGNGEPGNSVRDKIEQYHRVGINAFDSARQQNGALEQFYPSILYAITTLGSYVGLVFVSAISLLRRNRERSATAIIFLFSTLIGVAIHGGLVGPFARYHVKLSWLASFAITLWVLQTASSRASRT
ncbi:hypothetical protein HPT29_018215 [Microvirga terrae]|uniref:O-antigen ligase family protein n=1 Tax=Microvirga terrae TaxID=2740529 RepID=A0ABY5RMG8_9HYPH|nr:hypothetical protein [Microvirga terrae]UVF18423.1 hypothetical protein HPT29_018215 [Microvirga terrae]